MYTENVSEIMDDLMFDENRLGREGMRREGIRRLLENGLPVASGGHKYYCKPFPSEKVMEMMLKYYDANAREEDLIGFYDDTLFGTWSEGILFCADGMFIRELWARPVFIPYSKIICRRIEATRKKLVLPILGGEKREVIMSCDKKEMGQLMRLIAELYKRFEERESKK